MRLVVWDFDGTLADTRRVIEAGMDHTLAALGLPAALKEPWLACVGLPVDAMLQKVFAPLGFDPAAVLQAYRSFPYTEHEGLIQAYPGIPELLAALRDRGVRQAVASSKKSEALRRQAAALGWDGLFEPILTPTEVARPKPDPESLERILAHHGLAAEEAVMVGDTGFDLEMAARAGMPSVAVGYGFADPAGFAAWAPRAYAPDVPALSDILLAWSPPCP